jgi:hypothetical protein
MKIYAVGSLKSFPQNSGDKVDQFFFEKKLLEKYPNSQFILIPDLYEFSDILSQDLHLGNYVNGFHTDISGLIIPLGKDDTRVLSNISRDLAKRVGGEFKRELNEIIKDFDSRRYEYPLDEDNVEFEIARNNALDHFFYDSLRIPVFQAYKPILGYRFKNDILGLELDFHREITHVQIEYGFWLNDNFNNHRRR